MTYGTGTLYDFTARDHERSSGKAFFPLLCCGAALVGVVFACGWMLYGGSDTTRIDPVAATYRYETVVVERPAAPAARKRVVATADPTFFPAAAAKPTFLTAPSEPALITAPTELTLHTASEIDVALLHASRSMGSPPGAFVPNTPVVASLEPIAPRTVQAAIPVARDVSPLTVPRLADPRPPRTRNPALAAVAQRAKLLSIAAADKTIFQKLFGKPQPPSLSLAYAAPDGGVLPDGQSLTPGGLVPDDGLTAIYDLSAHTVYLPDGTKLEAHSGLGNRMDDPRFVNERMRGATPPHVYNLQLRQGLFHGVAALRLIPVGGESNIFGRTGILAHTYMLGPNGASNGCVSFKDYNTFLRAFRNGEIKRMVVVARLD